MVQALFEPLVALSNLKTSVIHFESFLKWDSMHQEWKVRRFKWLREVCRATTVRDLTALIMDLEDHILWRAVDAGWNDWRDVWLVMCASARTCHDLVSILRELEADLTSEAMHKEWGKACENWVCAVGWNDTGEYSSEDSKNIARGCRSDEARADVRPFLFKTCPRCGVDVRGDRLERHIQKVHRVHLVRSGSVRKMGSHRSLDKDIGKNTPRSLLLHIPIKISFDHYESGSSFCLSKCNRNEVKEYMGCLRKLTSMTWQQVWGQGGGEKTGLGFTNYEDHSITGARRPANISPELRISAIRASSKLRLFGVKIENVFHVLWFDREHTIVPGRT